VTLPFSGINLSNLEEEAVDEVILFYGYRFPIGKQVAGQMIPADDFLINQEFKALLLTVRIFGGGGLRGVLFGQFADESLGTRVERVLLACTVGEEGQLYADDALLHFARHCCAGGVCLGSQIPG
jgi:hypothetical protein